VPFTIEEGRQENIKDPKAETRQEVPEKLFPWKKKSQGSDEKERKGRSIGQENGFGRDNPAKHI